MSPKSRGRSVNEDPAGPARRLLARLTEEGVDLTDREQVDAAVGRFSAEQLAHRALAASRPPPVGAAFQLRIDLRDVEPPVWRRIVVPAEATLAALHDAVQVTMGWDDAHLHGWFLAGESYGVPNGEDVLPEDEVALGDVCTEGTTLQYTYDFGDSWEHDVTVERLLPPDEAGELPRCEAGAGACPPEDIGGAPGYAQLVGALNDRASASEWERELAEMYAGYDPGRFDADQATQRLRAVLPA